MIILVGSVGLSGLTKVFFRCCKHGVGHWRSGSAFTNSSLAPKIIVAREITGSPTHQRAQSRNGSARGAPAARAARAATRTPHDRVLVVAGGLGLPASTACPVRGGAAAGWGKDPCVTFKLRFEHLQSSQLRFEYLQVSWALIRALAELPTLI